MMDRHARHGREDERSSHPPAAGGTGGHLFPAEALANALKASGARVALATDKRANAYAGFVPGR